jgi:hypothetical protein
VAGEEGLKGTTPMAVPGDENVSGQGFEAFRLHSMFGENGRVERRSCGGQLGDFSVANSVAN